MRAAVQARGVAHVMFATGNSQLRVHRDTRDRRPRTSPGRTRSSFTWTNTSASGPTTRPDSRGGSENGSSDPHHRRRRTTSTDKGDAAAACSRYADLLARHPLDLCCLGIGENGHLAFNDPGVADFDDPLDVKVVELDTACRQQQVNEGHFPDIAAVPSHAITVTVPALLRAVAGHGRRPGGAQGRTGACGPDRSRLDRLPGLGPAVDPARNHLPRARVGPPLTPEGGDARWERSRFWE